MSKGSLRTGEQHQQITASTSLGQAFLNVICICIFLEMGWQHKVHVVFLLIFCSLAALSFSEAGDVDSDLPPIRTEVKYVDNKEKHSDDPESAWEEWDETPETKKNPFPKRQRKIEVGMDINSIMGMAMRQEKVVTAVLTKEYGSDQKVGSYVTQKFRNQMAAAGIACRLWFVLQGRQVIARCETIRDGHMCKDYMIRQHEIMRTVIDNVPFTPRPAHLDDDEEDEDEDDEEDSEPASKREESSKSKSNEKNKEEL